MINITKEHYEAPDGGRNCYQLKTIDSTVYQKWEGPFTKPFTAAEIIKVLSQVPDEFKDAPVILHESESGTKCKTITTSTEVYTDGRILHQVDLRTF